MCKELRAVPESNFCAYLSYQGDQANVMLVIIRVCVHMTGSIQGRNHTRTSNVSPFFWANDQEQQYLIKRRLIIC